MNVLALDIGGANLKAADGRGFAYAEPLPLWRDSTVLAARLRAVIAAAPPCDQLIATMTGELADCFATKAEGVAAILEAIEEAADGRPVLVYRIDGSLAPIEQARQDPLSAAASNWHALARFAARFVGDVPALLIDIGSTTTDLVPLVNGQLATTQKDDPGRLRCGELVYTGIERTPVCALVESLPWRGERYPVAAELFATTLDAYLILGDVPEDDSRTDTADGRGATTSCAAGRLARALCADSSQFGLADARQAAEAIQTAQLAKLRRALDRVVGSMPEVSSTYVVSGGGEFLARRLVGQCSGAARVMSLAKVLGPGVSRCAPAHALAVLGRETAPAVTTSKAR